MSTDSQIPSTPYPRQFRCFTSLKDPTTLFLASPQLHTVSYGCEDTTVDQQRTWMIPAIRDLEQLKNIASSDGLEMDHTLVVRKLFCDSGIYAIASCLSPLVALFLAPFLTHALSSSEYGVLTVLMTTLALLTGLTQCGLGVSFFRMYHHRDTSLRDRGLVLATVIWLLLSISVCVTLIIEGGAAWLSLLMLHNMAYSNLLRVVGLVLFMQNMTIPAFSWLRARGRSTPFVLLSVLNVLVNLGLTVLFVGFLRWGTLGALIALAGGYASVALLTVPFLLLRVGCKFQRRIAKNLLSFGLATVPGLLSVWILQLSDRYFLIYFGSLTQTASYAVAYTLGNVLGPLVITPFSLAWYSSIYGIAKKANAPDIFRQIFRWYCLALLLMVLCVSLFAKDLLAWCFPVGYVSAAPIIPLVALSNMFYGIFEIFMLGVTLQGNARFQLVFLPLAALLNIGCNLVLIPIYGSFGAALATLISYAVLALLAYLVNQRLYPVPFEIGLCVLALCLGIVCYFSNILLIYHQSQLIHWLISGSLICFYAGCLGLIATIRSKIYILMDVK